MILFKKSARFIVFLSIFSMILLTSCEKEELVQQVDQQDLLDNSIANKSSDSCDVISVANLGFRAIITNGRGQTRSFNLNRQTQIFPFNEGGDIGVQIIFLDENQLSQPFFNSGVVRYGYVSNRPINQDGVVFFPGYVAPRDGESVVINPRGNGASRRVREGQRVISFARVLPRDRQNFEGFFGLIELCR